MLEPTPLTIAWNALVDAIPKGSRSSVDITTMRVTVSATSVLTYAMGWHAVAVQQHAMAHLMTKEAITNWLRVEHAAEDLATAALTELRKAR